MSITLRAPTLGAAVLVLVGCSAGPHLAQSQLHAFQTTEVYYVAPKDDIVVTDPVATKLAHAGKFLTLDYLFGGIGVIAYFAGNKASGGMEDRVANQRDEFTEQRWPDRIRAAVDSVSADVPQLHGAAWKTLQTAPESRDMHAMALSSGFDTVVFLVPEMQMASAGDHLRMVIKVTVLSNPRNRPCLHCDFSGLSGDAATPMVGAADLDYSQALIAVDGGKTWEEQKQAGHRLHDLREADYALFWLRGDPPPLKGFMDAAFPALRAELEVYFGGKAQVPAPRPTLKMVVAP